MEAVNLAEDINSEMKSIRENVDEEFSKIFICASEVLNRLGSSIQIPRMAARQKKRVNLDLSSVTPELYFRVSTFIPFLDTFMSQLDSRFLKHKEILKGFQCLLPTNPVLLPLPSQVSAFTSLTEFYASDIRSGCQEDLNNELKLWYRKIARLEKGDQPKTAVDGLTTVSYTHLDVYKRQKLDVLNNVWEPNPGFVFPTKGKRNL